MNFADSEVSLRTSSTRVWQSEESCDSHTWNARDSATLWLSSAKTLKFFSRKFFSSTACLLFACNWLVYCVVFQFTPHTDEWLWSLRQRRERLWMFQQTSYFSENHNFLRTHFSSIQAEWVFKREFSRVHKSHTWVNTHFFLQLSSSSRQATSYLSWNCVLKFPQERNLRFCECEKKNTFCHVWLTIRQGGKKLIFMLAICGTSQHEQPQKPETQQHLSSSNPVRLTKYKLLSYVNMRARPPHIMVDMGKKEEEKKSHFIIS